MYEIAVSTDPVSLADALGIGSTAHRSVVWQGRIQNIDPDTTVFQNANIRREFTQAGSHPERRPGTRINAVDLYAQYQNEVEADRRYLDRVLQVEGTIEGIRKAEDFTVLGGIKKQLVVDFYVGQLGHQSLTCHFSKKNQAQLARLSKGQYIAVEGCAKGRNLGMSHSKTAGSWGNPFGWRLVLSRSPSPDRIDNYYLERSAVLRFRLQVCIDLDMSAAIALRPPPFQQPRGTPPVRRPRDRDALDFLPVALPHAGLDVRVA